MKLFKVSRLGNLYFEMSDNRIGVVYPKSGYVRIGVRGVNLYSENYSRVKYYQLNKKVRKQLDNGRVCYKRIRIKDVADQMELLLNFDKKNCITKDQ
jgi:hypothetical protein